ncbi:hypothetical protein FACS1894132_11810 [Clostridia bacterium]|nr:hypothetical protein FACS1894132_11810 [Clostridia bacterium]
MKKLFVLLLIFTIFVACSKEDFIGYDHHKDVPDLAITLRVDLIEKTERQTEDKTFVSAFVYDNIATEQYNKYAKKLLNVDFKPLNGTADTAFLDKYFSYMLAYMDKLYITPETANYFLSKKNIVTVINGFQTDTKTSTTKTITLVYIMSVSEFERLKSEIDNG